MFPELVMLVRGGIKINCLRLFLLFAGVEWSVSWKCHEGEAGGEGGRINKFTREEREGKGRRDQEGIDEEEEGAYRLSLVLEKKTFSVVSCASCLP